MSNNGCNAILGDKREEKRRERARQSNFLRNSHSTFNWLRSTIQTGVQSLQEDGLTKKDLRVFLDETLEESWREDYEKEFSTETLKALKQVKNAVEFLEKQDSEIEQNLAEKINLELEEFVEEYGLEDKMRETNG
jgi:hypothetical protein